MNDQPAFDDCFRPGSPLLRHDAAVAALRAAVKPVSRIERVPAAEAAGRVLATPVVAPFPVPSHTNSAVDGYAFAASDYDDANGTIFPLAGRAAAGHPLAASPASGSAVTILTGAVMPEGMDTVAMQEDCRRIEDVGAVRVHVPSGLKAGANVRRAGEDVAAGSELLAAGHLVRPQDLAALASVGAAEIDCYGRLEVGIVSTGDEVLRAGARPLRAGEVYDANSGMLAALVASAGARSRDLGIWKDVSADVVARLAEAAPRHDVLITSGGASKGSEDHMAAALGALGSRHFWEIAVKPGRPMMLGQIGRTVVVGLPGNPVAVFVCFMMYVYPMLRRMGGTAWPEPRRFTVPAAFSVPKRKLGRREFWRGRLVETPNGLAAEKYARDGSGLISGLRFADGLIDCPEDRASVAPGEPVAFIPFSEFGILGR